MCLVFKNCVPRTWMVWRLRFVSGPLPTRHQYDLFKRAGFDGFESHTNAMATLPVQHPSEGNPRFLAHCGNPTAPPITAKQATAREAWGKFETDIDVCEVVQLTTWSKGRLVAGVCTYQGVLGLGRTADLRCPESHDDIAASRAPGDMPRISSRVIVAT